MRQVLTTYGVGRTTMMTWIAAGHVEARRISGRGDLLINIPSVDAHIAGGLAPPKINPDSARYHRDRKAEPVRKRRLRRA